MVVNVRGQGGELALGNKSVVRHLECTETSLLECWGLVRMTDRRTEVVVMVYRGFE